jgi:hypothetical protein
MKNPFAAIAVSVLMATPAFAAGDDVKLPETLTWTSFDVGGTGYNQSIAVGKALQDAYGISLRVIAVSNDQARIAPVREGRIPRACRPTRLRNGVRRICVPSTSPAPTIASASAWRPMPASTRRPT